MKLRSYLAEGVKKMPLRQFRYFKAIVKEFYAAHPGYNYDKLPSINQFMRDLERYDYKSLSVLFSDLGVTSIDGFVSNYMDYVDKVNEDIDYTKDYSSPKDKARKAKLEKIVKIKSARAEYAHGSYVVELIGDKWPSDSDLIWFCDYPGAAPFGGRVSKGTGNTKVVAVHTD